MIDIHSHLIPFVDDGSKSEEMTIEMIKIGIENGTKKIVLTPHYIRGVYDIPFLEIEKKFNELKLMLIDKNLVKEIEDIENEDNREYEEYKENTEYKKNIENIKEKQIEEIEEIEETIKIKEIEERSEKISDEVNEKIEAKDIDDKRVELYLGQEVYFTKKLLEQYKNKEIGTINNTDYMLIEFKMDDFNIENIKDVIYELKIRGIKPIIAHPERYLKFIKKPELINELIEEGYLFQLNCGSLKGDFGKKVQKLAEKYIENKIYNFIGSDAHRLENRNNNMKYIIEFLDEEYFEFIKNSSEKMLKNEKIIFIGKKIEKKGILERLFR